jgi:hypothetical protein
VSGHDVSAILSHVGCYATMKEDSSERIAADEPITSSKLLNRRNSQYFVIFLSRSKRRALQSDGFSAAEYENIDF